MNTRKNRLHTTLNYPHYYLMRDYNNQEIILLK